MTCSVTIVERLTFQHSTICASITERDERAIYHYLPLYQSFSPTLMADKAQKEKEKGNAAFKAADYPTAIGHYSASIVADRKDPTYPLNRAAAYLKLGKFDDAERDCTTVLNLSPKSVKAYFRRGQSKIGLNKFIEAQRDFTEALRLEPGNNATKEELRKTAELIEIEKRKKTHSRKVDITLDASLSPTQAAKRRRIPISIIEGSASTSNSSEKPPKIASSIISSQINEVSPPVIETQTQITSAQSSTNATSSLPKTTSTPKPTSFQQAKQTRENSKTSRVGGGIFRANGQSTIFPTRTQSSSETQPGPAAHSPTSIIPVPNAGQGVATEEATTFPSAETTSSVTSLHVSQSPLPRTISKEKNGVEVQASVVSDEKSAMKNDVPINAPATLFDFNRLWRLDLSPLSRWKLIQTIPPSSMPAFCKSSLEPGLLVSILETFLAILFLDPETIKIKEYMDNLAKVPRFSTLVSFLSAKEKAIAKQVWQKLGVTGQLTGAWNALGKLDS